MTANTKNIAISCGPIPARLDSVKFITNRFKGGLAFKTAEMLAGKGDKLTVIVWRHTEVPRNIMTNPNVTNIVRVNDVFEYYDWYVANAKNFDAFVMAAAVANLTPVKPYEGKFPSHNYKPGDEFDIKFMIAPRAIDAIKAINPRCCLIGYKLFDTPDDAELIDIARHTQSDAKANIIFANRPNDAKTRKIAITPDGAAFECNFDEHVDLMYRAIHARYFKTEVSPMTESERSDPRIAAAAAIVQHFEKTFPKYGTVAIPAGEGRFVTTARGHKNAGTVLVRRIDGDAGIIYASGKATLNAPAMSAFLDPDNERVYAIHRHFDDPMAENPYPMKTSRMENYNFPGTMAEYLIAKHVVKLTDKRIEFNHHGYIQRMNMRTVDWNRYHATFPEKYFGTPAMFQSVIDMFDGKETLEIGGNEYPAGKYSYDPFVNPRNDATKISYDEIAEHEFDLAFARNAICYLTRDELEYIIKHAKAFIANAPLNMPDIKVTDTEIAYVDDPSAGLPMLQHYLMTGHDEIVAHEFHAYNRAFYESLGLRIRPYGKNSCLVYKGLTLPEDTT